MSHGSQSQGMDLDGRRVAWLLGVSEDQVERWARSGELPSYRVQGRYRFNRVQLLEWATARGMKLKPDLYPHGSRSIPSLHDALARGGIVYDLPGDSAEEVLAAVAQLPAIPEHVDRHLLAQLLVGREALASTGIGEGLALPHPRDPLVVQVEAPLVLLCFLRRPIDYGAVDGQPVKVLFTLLSPSVQVHLQILSRLAYALHDEPLRQLITSRAGPEAILRRFAELSTEPTKERAKEREGEEP